nr:type III-A CRISPR-associated RAMP protein Csm3 [uncultured Campylobacter sp.]
MKILSLKGKINILTGLHIGGGDDTMKIGGIDNQVIKDPLTKLPYIPGSSLKGKMRSLLEWDNQLAGLNDGKPFSSAKLNLAPNEQNAKTLLKLFGDANDKKGEDFAITRISVGDAFLEASQAKKAKDGELVVSEAKYENVIDRSKGIALNPRQTERVPAGLSFDFDIRIKVLDGDDENALKAMVGRGLELVEKDYLGGSGSRGYGRVEFSNKTEWE